MKNILITTLFLASFSASAATIDFANDSIGDKANGFSSTGHPEVTFSDSLGQDLNIQDFGVQSFGNGLAVFSDDPSRLIMNFSSSFNQLSLAFGNDDPFFSNQGDMAWLNIFDGNNLLSTLSLLLNRNDIMDQTISYSGAAFNKAEFYYGDAQGNAINLIEVVDSITYSGNAVPEPTTIALMGLGFAGMACRRRKTV